MWCLDGALRGRFTIFPREAISQTISWETIIGGRELELLEKMGLVPC
jgi:hypothetical protein